MGKTGNTRWWGPVAVASGAALWGIETFFRVDLQKVLASDVLVFYEHVFGILLLLPVLIAGRAGLKKFKRRSAAWLFVSGVVGSGFGTVFFTASLANMNISVANVLLNLQPLVSVTLAYFFLKERVARGFAPWALVAVLAGIGISLENLDAGSFRIEHVIGLFYAGLTILCWGAGTVAGRGLMLDVPLSVAAPLRFVLGGVAAYFLVVIDGNLHVLSAQTPLIFQGWVIRNYLWLLLAAGITPLFLYFYGLKYTSATAGAFCEMVQTLAAVVVTWAVMGQPLKTHQVIAGVVLMIAVTQVNLLQARSASHR
jgi:drug/metabolite transporter (DMT)-like permease